MSEETKQPAEETPEEPQEAPQEEAPPAEEKVPDEKAEKAARGKKKKEKTYTLTREQMEAAELAARQLESVKDQFVRLTAEYDNYRKRTAKEKDNLYQDAKADTIKEFLAVYDNLERAVATEGDEDLLVLVEDHLQPLLVGRVLIAFSGHSHLTRKSTTPLCTSTMRTLGRTWYPRCSRRGSCWVTR